MRSWLAAVALVLVTAAPLAAADSLAEARRLYNLGDYEKAERFAREAVRVPALADGARIVIGRIRLERFRRSAAQDDLVEARSALREVDPRALDARERVELAVGLAESLFLEDRFGAAAEVFESALDYADMLGPAARERVLDWWASSLDRDAQLRPFGDRGPIYDRIGTRMTSELARDPGSTPGGYWVVVAARGAGNLDRAWNLAFAGWVRGVLAQDRGAALRADLDRLVLQALVPERAARLALRDTGQAVTGMLTEWEAFKTAWAR